MPALIKDDPELYVIYVMRDPRDTICSRHGKDNSIIRTSACGARCTAMQDKCPPTIPRNPLRRLRPRSGRDTGNDRTEVSLARKNHKFSEYHEYAQISEKSITAMHSVRPIAPTSVVLDEFPGRIKAQQIIHGSLTPELIECGYESSADWEKVLEDAEPDLHQEFIRKNYIFGRACHSISMAYARSPNTAGCARISKRD